MARESSAAAQCRNNLRQIGVACHSHLASTGKFPASGFIVPPGRFAFSSLVKLLPYLEQANLYQQFKFDRPPASFENQQLILKSPSLGVLNCPTDGNSSPVQTNYVGNLGTGPGEDLRIQYNGFLDLQHGTRPQDFADGLSNTVAFSECMSFRNGRERGSRILSIGPAADDWAGWKSFRESCRAAPADGGPVALNDGGLVGQWWISPVISESTYNHVLPPGSHSCMNDGKYQTCIVSASSRHPNSVHILLADGSVSSVSTSIDESLWTQMGSRRDDSP
jgi:prepilin-type processing-associated H-X9-DG protein